MKPRIICYMYTSVDGKIDCEMTELIDPVAESYYDYLDEFEDYTIINGRTTCQMHYASEEDFVSKSEEKAGYQVFKAEDAESYHVVLDTNGKTIWTDTDGTIDDRPIIVVTSENVGTDYLSMLKSENISFICTGKEKINLTSAMEVLCEEFGVVNALLTGGGKVNGSFVDENLVDEVHLMIGPGIDGRSAQVSVFDGRQEDREPIKLKLIGAKKLENDTMLLKYKI